MVSIMRDTWMNMAKYTDEYYEFDKANSAYNRGGPESMLSMLNTNLDLALTDYVTVNFKALADAIDVLGGLDIEMTNAECVHANNYNREVSEAQGVEYEAIPYDEDLGDDYSEVRHVSGALATSYARIRYGGGDDYRRTERQRTVLTAMMQKAQKSNILTLNKLINAAFGDIQTSFSNTDLLALATKVFSYDIGDTTGFPYEKTTHKYDKIGDVVIPCDLASNVTQLHQFLFNDENYTPSATVLSNSQQIISNTGYKQGDGH